MTAIKLNPTWKVANHFCNRPVNPGLVLGTYEKGKTMKHGVANFFKRTFGSEHNLHPLDRGLAKHWIKRRLVAVFPELRADPVALEQAYRDLSLEPRFGGENGADSYFEMTLPGL
jgi:hypothetical protein